VKVRSGRKVALIAIVAAVVAVVVAVATTSMYVEAQANNGRKIGNGVGASCQCQYLPLRQAFKWGWGKELGFGKVGKVIAPFKPLNVVVSDDYKNAILIVLQNNETTKGLLEKNYTLTYVKPIFNAYVSGDGTVTIKATEAVAVLTFKSDSKVSIAYAYVDLVQGEVVKLVTFEKNIAPAKTTTSTPGTSA